MLFVLDDVYLKLGAIAMEYMTLKEAADKWGIGDRRVNALCLQGRIEGAVRFGNAWAIPVDAEKPSDARIKTGKYIKGDK